MVTIEIQLDAVQSLGLAVIFLLIGRYSVKTFNFLARTTIPPAIIGSFIFALANTFAYLKDSYYVTLHGGTINFVMVFYFVTIGFNASLKALSQSRSTVFRFFGLSLTAILLQNILAIASSRALNFPSLLGLLMGSTSLVGGPATAAALAPTIEQMGYPQAAAVGLTAATIGIIVGSSLAAPLGNQLIQAKDLAPSIRKRPSPERNSTEADPVLKKQSGIYQTTLMILLAMFLGSFITEWINGFMSQWIEGISFPIVLGPMLVAFALRNLSDSGQKEWLDIEGLDSLAKVSLDLFLSLTIVGLELWQVFNLALPMFIILLLETLMTLAFAYFIVFHVMGRDYDAAMMTAGFVGFGMGTSSNALAAIDSLANTYYPSPKAVLTVSIVAGLLVDFTNVLIIYAFVGFLA